MKIPSLFLMAACILVFGIIVGLTECKEGNEETIPEITTLKITNANPDSVLVYVTLGGGGQYLNNVKGMFGIDQSGLQGSFYLKSGDTLSYTCPSNMALHGNFCFGRAPINCPDGTTIYEFTLNNSMTGAKAQETVDISCVAGVTAIAKYHLEGGGEWIADTHHQNITAFHNSTYNKNSGLVGVFPYGCDDCTASVAPPKCVKNPATPQTEAICNVSRNAKESGGTVTVTFVKLLR